MEGSDKAVFVRNQHRGKAAAATHGDEGQASEREAGGCLCLKERCQGTEPGAAKQ